MIIKLLVTLLICISSATAKIASPSVIPKPIPSTGTGANGQVLTITNAGTDVGWTTASGVDTNANTICSGTTTYLDGEGNCDDISSVYEPAGITESDISDYDPASAAMARIAGSTYSTIQHMQDIFHSTGASTGGTITDNGSETFNVAAGTGFIRATDSAVAELVYFDWAASSGNAIPTNTVRYVGVEYNAGSPQVVVKTTDTWDYNTDFPLGTVINQSTSLHITNIPHQVGDHASKMIQRAYATMPLARDNRTGGLILGETGTRNMSLTAGTIWEKLDDHSIAAIDTSVSGDFTAYYRDGGGGWTEATGLTQWPNTQYDDNSGTLQTMTNNRYANLWFYLELDGDLVMLYGQAEHTSLAGAEDEAAPSSVPSRISAHGKLIGRVIFQKSASAAVEVQSVFGTTFAGSTVTDHGALTGLTDDDHTQYHTDARALTWLGTRATTDLPEGTNLYYTAARANGEIAEAIGVSVQAWDTDLDTLATNDGSSLTGVDAATVDGIDSTSFLRSDANDSFTAATLTIDGNGAFNQSAYFDAIVDDGNSGAADTIDWRIGNKHKSTLTANATYSFTDPAGPTSLQLFIFQDGTGSRAATWPAGVKWPGGTACTLTATANAMDIVSLVFNGSPGQYYGQCSNNYQ